MDDDAQTFGILYTVHRFVKHENLLMRVLRRSAPGMPQNDRQSAQYRRETETSKWRHSAPSATDKTSDARDRIPTDEKCGIPCGIPCGFSGENRASPPPLLRRSMGIVAGLVVAAAIAGCKTDEQRYAELRQDALASCLCVHPACSAYTPSEAQQAKCAVAERKLARFMAGR